MPSHLNLTNPSLADLHGLEIIKEDGMINKNITQEGERKGGGKRKGRKEGRRERDESGHYLCSLAASA